MRTIEEHRAVQTVAKAVLARLADDIGPGNTERSIARLAVQLLAEQGVTETWYYDCPAMVLLGSRSCLSVSGRDYRPSDEPVGLTNLVTVDLSPSRHGVWGDCARSFAVEEGRCVEMPRSPEFRRGMTMERRLHEDLLAFATADTTFGELHEHTSAAITAAGFVNLDFLGNVGHSIESRRDDRCYIEAGNARRLGEVALFTFEPHIREAGGAWGFKHESIYRCGPSGRVEEL
jgi:Xaa-Pro aminopeptidase